ncbi:CTLH/CRA C-terminal to lish motif domain-containing protein [Gautieria morchelliformis]|nr:CTLH/CRA C-terminal to lish motif domain-containing protein [Gautieria morchelliformis]
MSTNKLNVEGILLLEQPFAKVPYENLRKIFRTSQKYIEREMTAVQNASLELEKRATQHTYEPSEALKTIDSMIGRVEGLKRKLSDLSDRCTIPTHAVMRKRLEHLNSLDTMSGRDDAEFNRWADIRLDRWLVDWALRTGKEKTARQIAHDRGIEALVDIDLFSEIHRIEDALRNHSCTEALAWCSENKSALRKIKSTLEFDLRLQEYIELTRARKYEEAIPYSKKYLTPWYETHGVQITQAFNLLAFPPTTTCAPYKRLYDTERWTVLSRTFRLAAYNLSTLPTEPLLHLALYAGLASLKLPSCYPLPPTSASAPSNPPIAFSSSSTSLPFSPSTYSSLSANLIGTAPYSNSTTRDSSKSIDCPICDHECLGELAKEVPWSHHVNSTIVCRISGKIMDEDNMPLCFPNGYVYSREALEDMAAKRGGQVTCPRTGDTCDFSVLRKVFIS